MILFKKQKVKKIVAEYERIWKQTIPESAICVEELEGLKILSLKEQALVYDLLEGWRYSDITIPQLSMYKRSSVPAKTKSASGLQRKLRAAKFARKESIAKERFDPELKYVEDNGELWLCG